MSRELLDQGVDPTDDTTTYGSTYGNTAHFDPFDGDAGPDEDINPWVTIPLDTCPYCYKTMDWMGCPHCEMSGMYDGKRCTLCVGHGGWYSCDDCELIVTLDQQVTELRGDDERAN